MKILVPVDGSAESLAAVRHALQLIRAYRMRGWPEIPAIIKPAPESISRRLMTQMNENLARVDTTLWENAVAVNTALEAWKLEHRSGMVKDFARDFGRAAPGWERSAP